MGLTRSSVGHSLGAERASVGHADYTVALAGNPNVGKSTVFNALTGMHQHTGNWAGKTVGNAIGYTVCDGKEIALVDIPGTYSLMAHSREEEIARDFVCFGLPVKRRSLASPPTTNVYKAQSKTRTLSKIFPPNAFLPN